MANRFKKCSMCHKRRRGTNCISLTPSPIEVAEGVEICVTIAPQPPTKLCSRCLRKIANLYGANY